jgi:hypothetical protein
MTSRSPDRYRVSPCALCPGLFLGPGVVTATNVVVPISCSLLSTYFTYFCTGAIARDNVKVCDTPESHAA